MFTCPGMRKIPGLIEYLSKKDCVFEKLNALSLRHEVQQMIKEQTITDIISSCHIRGLHLRYYLTNLPHFK